jgi:hypothetical protein
MLHKGVTMNTEEARRAHTERMIAEAIQQRRAREQGYREQALKLYPWICGRCAREFTRQNLHQLTVHHRDHNHDNNPKDGSNWELLCLYCHDNEHARRLDSEAARRAGVGEDRGSGARATSQPFAGLKELLGKEH